MKNKQARVMVLVHDTLSEYTLQMYEVSLKYLLGYQVIERTRFCDRQTHGWAQGKNNMSSGPGRHNFLLKKENSIFYL